MATASTREALLEQGALLFARHGVDGVTTRRLHDAIGSRNESALHYHFGNRAGLVEEILRVHLAAIEERRAPLVAAIAAEGREADVPTLVRALAAPMAADLGDELGRAHLRMVGQLNHPALARERPFQVVDAPAGRAVVRWLRAALSSLPEAIRTERLAGLRDQIIGLFAARAELIDGAGDPGAAEVTLYLENVVDVLAAGLVVPPSAATLAAAEAAGADRPDPERPVTP